MTLRRCDSIKFSSEHSRAYHYRVDKRKQTTFIVNSLLLPIFGAVEGMRASPSCRHLGLFSFDFRLGVGEL